MPLLFPTLAFMAGIAAGCLMPDYTVHAAVLTAVACITFFIARMRRVSSSFLFAAIGVAVAAVGNPQPIAFEADNEPHLHTGVVTAVTRSDYNQRLLVRTDTPDGYANVAVSYHAMLPLVEAGDGIEFRAPVRPLTEHYLAPDEFFPRGYYLRNAVSATAHVGAGDLQIVSPATGWRHTLDRWRSQLSHFIFYRCGLSPNAADMLDAVLTGNDDMLSPVVRERFALSGTAHVLALSGMHVAVIAFMVSLLFWPLSLAGHRHAGRLCVLLAVWFYVALVGFPPSVTRTAVMASMLIGGQLLFRGSSSMNNLCLAAIVILVVTPRSLFSPAFQLSFSAVASILMFMPYMRLPKRYPRAVRLLWQWCAVSICAMAGTCALAAYYFHQMPLLFLAANLPLSLLLPPFMIVGVLVLVLSWAGLPVAWAAWVENGIYEAMAGVCGWVASVDGGAIRAVYPGWPLVAAGYVALCMLWVSLKKRTLAPAMAGIMVLFAVWGVDRIWADNRYEPHVSALYDFYGTTVLAGDGHRAVVLTDAPVRHHAGLRERLNFRLGDYMARRGIDSLDIVSTLFRSAWIEADSAVWRIGDVRMVLLNRPLTPEDAAGRPDMHNADFMIVTTGFPGDIEQLVAALRPGCVVLSRRLGAERRQRLEEALRAAGTVYSVGLEGDLSSSSPRRK